MIQIAERPINPAALVSPHRSSAVDAYILAARDAGCPRQQIENFIRGGIVLQPKQLAASAVARECDFEGGPVELGYGGARGGGKSHWLLAQLAEDCLRFPGLKCLLLRKVGKSNRENFEDLRQKVLHSVPNVYKRQDGILLFPNGSRIVLGHFQNEGDIDAYLGLEYDVIGVEEATTLSHSKYKAIQSCNRTSKAGWRPRMYSTTNPGGVGHAWYKQRFIAPMRKRQETETRFVQATVDDNRMVNAGYRKVLDSFVGWMLRSWRYGDWDIAAGQYFTNFRSDLHVTPWRTLPKSWRAWCSMDYGFTHFNTVYLLVEDGDGKVYVADEHAERKWLPRRHVPAINAMLERNGRSLSDLEVFVAGADVFSQRGNGTTIAQTYEELGIYLSPADDDRVNGAAELLTRLGDMDAEEPIEPTIEIFDRCGRLVECIPSMEHNPRRPEDVRKVNADEEGIGGDDPYDGARYGLMVSRAGRELEFS